LQSKAAEQKKKVFIPIAAVIAVGLVIFLSNRPVRMANGEQIIESEEQYNYALGQVAKSTPAAVGKFNVGEELETADKEIALKGAKTFDSMNAFRPDMSAGYFESGLLYYLGGDTETAEARLNQAIADKSQPVNIKQGTQADLDAVIADCHHMLSLIAFDHHDYKKAGEEAEKALLILKTRESYYIARAQAEVQLKMLPQAKSDVASALKLNPTYLPATRLNGFLNH
jgi:tetratricopeptide (TPR) repeat protein